MSSSINLGEVLPALWLSLCACGQMDLEWKLFFLSSGLLLFPSVATVFVWAMGLLNQSNIYWVTRQPMEKLDLDHIVQIILSVLKS